MRVALYLRVSTDKQEMDVQESQLRNWMEHEGHKIRVIYRDISSGKNDFMEREGLYQLLEACKKPRKEFDLVVFWALDRLTREGTLRTLTYLEQFKNLGIRYHSYTEPYISTLGPFADVVISLLGTLAKIERQKISERTKAGLARARRRGRRLGRPRVPHRVVVRVQRCFKEGMNAAAIAQNVGIGETSVRRILKGQH